MIKSKNGSIKCFFLHVPLSNSPKVNPRGCRRAPQTQLKPCQLHPFFITLEQWKRKCIKSRALEYWELLFAPVRARKVLLHTTFYLFFSIRFSDSGIYCKKIRIFGINAVDELENGYVHCLWVFTSMSKKLLIIRSELWLWIMVACGFLAKITNIFAKFLQVILLMCHNVLKKVRQN